MFSKLTIRSRRNRKGFTLIELLVVVLILAILMAVALPLYLSSVSDAQKKTCRANMQTIANAEQAAYVRGSGVTAYFAGAVATNCGVGKPLSDLQAAPICPTGGVYTVVTDGTAAAGNGTAVPTGTPVVKCSLHNNFAPGFDSN